MGTCHCSRCRKVGAGTFVFVRKEHLVWTQGKDHVRCHEAVPPYEYNRCCCPTCGTSLGEILSEEDCFPVAAQAIDDEILIENRFHEFVAEKPAWCVIGDEAQQFDRHPPSA